MKRHLKNIGGVALLFLVAIGGGTILGFAIQQAASEPEQCALHDRAMVCHAPVLMNLATGEYVELQVYDYLSPSSRTTVVPRTGVARISHAAGVTTFSNAGHYCTVDLPQVGEVMRNELFCRRCCLLLSMAEAKGYAIVDLHDPDHIRPYAIVKGQAYEINGYTVSIEKGSLPFSLTVKVIGHLLDGQ